VIITARQCSGQYGQDPSRYRGGAGVVSAGPDPGAGGVVGVRVGVSVMVCGPSGPGTTVVVGVVSVGDVGLVVSPGDVVSVGLVVVGVVVVVVVTGSWGLRTLVRGTHV
jgi:hypothetical protein